MQYEYSVEYRTGSRFCCHLFNFTILAGGLYLLLYRPVKEFMQKRDAYYQGINDQAEQLKQQADQLKKDYQQKLSEADSEIARKEPTCKSSWRLSASSR